MKLLTFISLLIVTNAFFYEDGRDKELEKTVGKKLEMLATAFEDTYDLYENDFKYIEGKLYKLKNEVENVSTFTAYKWYYKVYPLYNEMIDEFQGIINRYLPSYNKNFQEILNKSYLIFLQTMQKHECNVLKGFVKSYNETDYHTGSQVMEHFYLWQTDNNVYC